ncbi:dGTP triphosphohydrolase [Photobacterium damselae]|uniref:dGTP triphosphohydrolase n=1 Tax=Photobacterium damselae TaxID=38293 RepID=UPI0025436693|nr:dNTP triphosphohydrolase [Photobacterium damselae]WIH19329.1 dNTP triphosphohydrolase [Photobacterium damselae]
MNWNKLLNNSRRKDKHKQVADPSVEGQKKQGTSAGREEIERDFDRILFLAPTRRLADKTQVFPLEQNDSVRTRLTHSFEVSNLARGIGTRLAFDHPEIFDGHALDARGDRIERTIPSLLAAIGLAHDLGNPPFGHQGESAIRDWFKKNKEMVFESDLENPLYQDFLKFDGNSQTIRLLTQLQILNDKFGINLTYSTLAALVKYPLSSKAVDSHPTWEKHGFFASEEAIIKETWEETGLQEGVRHPLTYIMEACDDIAYSVLDAEDIVKKGLASFYDLVNHLSTFVAEKNTEIQSSTEEKQDSELITKMKEEVQVIESLVGKIKEKNEEYSKEDLSPAELNDLSMQMFRVFAIGALVESVIEAYVQQQPLIQNTEAPPQDLMSLSKGKALCKALKKFDKKWGYRNKSVLKLELEGCNYIQELMSMLWIGIHGKLNDDNKHESDTPFGKYAYEKISENYRRVFEDKSNDLPVPYKESQLLTDAISGMTDSYLIALHTELKNLYRE